MPFVICETELRSRDMGSGFFFQIDASLVSAFRIDEKKVRATRERLDSGPLERYSDFP